ncbi:hypothetical protein SEPCBS57363_006038 [Sporothrix epigloea]|uniref:Uncharacterized protein n=1 Tax=Sporothrix epigloea TaxID=1892477 RepID=A0ABP0E411_9PEZI
MPQLPAASQPIFSTPDASRFRRLNTKYARQSSTLDGRTPPPLEGQSSAVRPAPRSRFAYSWQQQQQHHIQTPTPTQTPLPSGRRFHVSGARQTIGRGEDVIEDGSSPARSPDSPALASQDDAYALVVRESPTATRILKLNSNRAGENTRQQARADLKGDIQIVSSSMESDVEQDTIQISGDTTADERDEVLMPDSIPEETSIAWPAITTVATPTAHESSLRTRPRSSAARLLSSIQPSKRRRLFLSPGLITSSPPDLGLATQSHDNPSHDSTVFGETDESAPEEEPEDGATVMSPDPLSLAFAARFKYSRYKPGVDGDDDIVDNGSASHGDYSSSDDEDIRDILRYGELLEYGDSPDNDRDAMLPKCRYAHDMHKDETDGWDDAGYDTDMMLDVTPPRVRQTRLLRLQRQRQQQQQAALGPLQPLPTFQRARMFVAARKPTGEGETDKEGEEQDIDRLFETAEKEDDSPDMLATPSRRRYLDALHYLQPPPDLFSPQMKRRRPKRKSRGYPKLVEDELVSPSAASMASSMAAINAPEQYVPSGLAAGLRDWLIQMKGGDNGCVSGNGGKLSAAVVCSGRFDVEEMRAAPGLCLALGRRQGQRNPPPADTNVGNARGTNVGPPVRLLLAGDRRQHVLDQSAIDSSQPVVSIAFPAWNVVLDGQPWIVATNWTMQEREQST